DTTTGKTIQTVLDSGESDRTWDAGIIASPGAITGTVLEDTNNDNVGDTPLAGVTVVLKDPVSGTVISTTTTDASGNYSFNGVPPGNYVVQETNKPGYTDVSDKDGGDLNSIAVTVTPGSTNSGNNFVDERLPGAISGTVREDNDNNNTGDTPIAGVTVALINATTGLVVATTTTDVNGNYTFTGVPAGTYNVVETNKPGYTDVGDKDGGNPNSISVTLTPGQSSTGNDFVDERPATLGDKVWEDTNANGVQDAGEAGIAGVTVVLKDATGTPISTTTTDTNGNYSFTVTPGTYSVAVQAPAGYVVTGQDQGANEATDSDVNSTGQSANVTLVSGQNNPNVDAGLYKLAELGDKVWLDSNSNGVQDAGEAGVTGVKVTLLDAAGNAVTSTTTDASGNYLFSGLKPGTYSVQFDKATLPAGYAFTTKDAAAGTDLTDSDADTTTGKTIQTVLDSGESDRSWDAGIVANTGNISGTVREDLDNNNTGDAPIAGVTVALVNPTTGAIIATTTTDVNGNYVFTNVPAGSYSVVETNKTGYIDVSDKDGGNPNSISVTLTPGQSSTGNDFVDERTAAIGDKVWLDTNANGVQDAGEAGVSGVTVKLLDSTGNVVSTTATDANGNYLFSSLAPGDYAIQVTAPAGYVVTGKDQGGNDATDSDIDPTTGKTINTTLSAGETDLSWDAGIYKTASLGDKVWLDSNKNGVQDSGEAGVSGVTVKLLDALGNVVATATTDASGNYLFSNLIPGSYAVQVVAPTGYTFTTKDSASATDLTDSDVDATTGKTVLTTLDSGENDLSWDAGLVAPVVAASYGDKVWLDKNANGVQDAGEAGLSGVTVKLLNSAGSVVATTTTDANGNYLFTNLTPGDYSAQVVAPTGYFISAKDQGGNDATDSDFDPTTGKTITTTLSANENDLSWDAGLYQKASIGDKVWADCNNNGIQDATESGVPGITVKLLNAAGAVVATTLTDINGNYVFKDLMPGTYSVQFVAPTGYTFTTKDVGSNDAVDSDVGGTTVIGTTNLITNGSFENGTTGWCGNGDYIEVNTAGAYGVSAVTGAMVLELDANKTNTVTGVYQDITTVAGQSYQLSVDVAQRAGYAASTNTVEVFWEGVKIATIDPTSTALTKYTFTVTAADASSRLEFREQAGDDDSVGGIIDNVSLVTINGGGTVGTTIQTTLESGENDLTWDAGLTVKPVTACFDFTGNTATDGTDGNLLCYSNNGISVNASAFSRDKTTGAWAKAYLGAYGGGLGVTDSSEGTGSGNTHTVDNNGTRDNYVLFEFSQTVVVDKAYLGYVVGDSDAKVWIGTVNGAFDSHITLSDAVLTSMGFTEVSASTLTSARWAELNAGGVAGNVLIVAANPGQTDDYFKLQQVVVSTPSAFCATDVSIGDKVWEDTNKNGVQDAGEAGIAGVTVKLLNGAGSVVATTTTDSTGSYLFSKLAAGDYKIQVVTPNGYAITSKDAGGNDATDSDIDSTGTTGLYTLTQGSNNLTVDAGFYKPAAAAASIGDRVWEDKNFNGIQDSGEAGIKGVTVKLLNSAGSVVATATTDASGNYLFSNLAAGDYKVQVVTPTGYYVTKQDQAGWNGTDSAVNASGYTGTIALAAGQSLLKADAGLYRKASVGDKVWLDSDSDGIQDSGECGVANVTVKLLNAAGAVIATTTTDSAGCYKFSNLDPGQYSLQFDKSNAYYYTGSYDWWGNAKTQNVSSTGYQWTTKDVGSNAYDTTDSDVARVSSTYYNQGNTDKFTLVSGQYDSSRDAGVCPIVIDLDGNGIQTISRENANGTFDLFGTGVAVSSGWLSSGDAFLAIDANGNGVIDGINELFGGNGAGQGFAKLASFDSNGDGVVDAGDAAFASLSVWRDANSNQQTDAGELMSLSEAGVASMAVSYFALPAVDEQGNLHLERSTATLADGSSVDMTDVYFNVDAAEAAQAGITLPTISELLSNDVSLDEVLGASVAVGEVAAPVTVSDSAVAALSQLSHLYEEQQFALAAA
ncbi:SdrD B-like domain-containing protein, partial [uncultured Zoogloea sp.]|uniref:SdrD B-like domain-containing protein n=1 Tax=uncultured Zoogloea sp. TaxID=160237 RepID=UPI002620EC23